TDPLQCSYDAHNDPPTRTRDPAWRDTDLHVSPERAQEIHEASEGEPFQLVIVQGDHRRSSHFQTRSRGHLREPLMFDEPVDFRREAYFGIELDRVPHAQVRKDVTGTRLEEDGSRSSFR